MTQQDQFLMLVQTYVLSKKQNTIIYDAKLPMKVLSMAMGIVIDDKTLVFDLAVEFVDKYWRELTDPDRLPIYIEPPKTTLDPVKVTKSTP